MGRHTIRKTSKGSPPQMVERYAPKAKQAVKQMRDFVRQGSNNKGMFEVLDNANTTLRTPNVSFGKPSSSWQS